MTIRVMCDSCFAEMKFKDEAAGKKTTCKQCGTQVTIKRSSSSAATSAMPPVMRSPPKKNPSPKKKTSAKHAKNTSGNSSGSKHLLIALMLIVAVGGSIAGGYFFLRNSKDTASTETVETVSREEKTFFPTTNEGVTARSTTEWFGLIRESRRTDNMTRMTILRSKTRDAENFIGADPAALPVVLNGLAYPETKHVSEAILKKFSDSEPPYFQDLLDGLAHENPAVKMWSVRLLALRPDKSFDVVKTLEPFVNDEQLAKTAWETLGMMGSNAVPVFEMRMQQAEYPHERALLGNISSLGSDAVPLVPGLILVFERDDKQSQKLARTVLGNLGPAAKAALPALVESMRTDEDKDSLTESLETITLIGPDAYDPLLSIINEDLGGMRSQAIAKLANLGSAAIPAIPELIRLLENTQEDQVTYAILTALQRLLPEADLTLDQLTTLLNQPVERMVQLDDGKFLSTILKKIEEKGPEAKPLVSSLQPFPPALLQQIKLIRANRQEEAESVFLIFQKEGVRLEISQPASVLRLSNTQRQQLFAKTIREQEKQGYDFVVVKTPQLGELDTILKRREEQLNQTYELIRNLG